MLETISELDPDWAAWFTGFCDGEASLNINKNGSPYIRIALRDDDFLILDEIQKTLGGSVKLRKKRGSSQDQYCWSQYGPSCYKAVHAIRNGNDNWNAWFAGFCDGESTFNIDQTGSPVLKITLREDDKHILYEIASKLGGSVQFESSGSNRAKGMKANDCFRWRICGPSCIYAINVLRGNMRTKKAKDFEIWAEAVEASIALGSGRSKLRKPMMLEYKKRLEAVRAYKKEETV